MLLHTLKIYQKSLWIDLHSWSSELRTETAPLTKLQHWKSELPQLNAELKISIENSYKTWEEALQDLWGPKWAVLDCQLWGTWPLGYPWAKLEKVTQNKEVSPEKLLPAQDTLF